MTSDRKKLGSWARLSAKVYQDSNWLDCGKEARLVFLTGIAIAKDLNDDGRVDLRIVIGSMYGVMESHEVEMAAGELVDNNLWSNEGNGRYLVRSFLKWNESTGEQSDHKSRKRVGALTTNHKLGRHSTQLDDCPLCQSEGNVSPGQRPIEPSRSSDAASERYSDADIDIDRDVDIDREKMSQPSCDDTTEVTEATALAEHLAASIALRPENSKRGRSTDAWVTEIDRMIRLDDRDPADIRAMIDWLFVTGGRQAHFWAKNVRSPKKLREKFDSLRSDRADEGFTPEAEQVDPDRVARFCMYFHDRAKPGRPLETIQESGDWRSQWEQPARQLLVAVPSSADLAQLVDFALSPDCFRGKGVSNPGGLWQKLDGIRLELEGQQASSNRLKAPPTNVRVHDGCCDGSGIIDGPSGVAQCPGVQATQGAPA